MAYGLLALRMRVVEADHAAIRARLEALDGACRADVARMGARDAETRAEANRARGEALGLEAVAVAMEGVAELVGGRLAEAVARREEAMRAGRRTRAARG